CCGSTTPRRFFSTARSSRRASAGCGRRRLKAEGLQSERGCAVSEQCVARTLWSDTRSSKERSMRASTVFTVATLTLATSDAFAQQQQQPAYPRDPPVASERSPGALDQAQPPSSTNPTREMPPSRESSSMRSATSVTPQSFAKQAAVIGKAEVEIGQIAMT